MQHPLDACRCIAAYLFYRNCFGIVQKQGLMYTQFTEPVRPKKLFITFFSFSPGSMGQTRSLGGESASCVKLNGFNKLTILHVKTSEELQESNTNGFRWPKMISICPYTEALRYCAVLMPLKHVFLCYFIIIISTDTSRLAQQESNSSHKHPSVDLFKLCEWLRVSDEAHFFYFSIKRQHSLWV